MTGKKRNSAGELNGVETKKYRAEQVNADEVVESMEEDLNQVDELKNSGFDTYGSMHDFQEQISNNEQYEHTHNQFNQAT